MARRFIPFEALKPEKGIPFTKTHIWRLEKAEQFPRRVKIGGGSGGRNTYAWPEDEIDAHVEALIDRHALEDTAWRAFSRAMLASSQGAYDSRHFVTLPSDTELAKGALERADARRNA